MATTGTDTTDERTLHVRFRESDKESLDAALAELDQGGTPGPTFEVVFHDPEDVHRVTRPKNLELLRAIVQHEPESIRDAARLVERDVRQVHRNISELADLHLVELVEDGQAKRPCVWYDAIELDLPLSASNSETDQVEA